MTYILSRCALAATLLALMAVGAAAADEFVEIVVPLREGRYFSPRDFCEQCNERLGTQFPLPLITDRQHRLSDRERQALFAANLLGVLRTEIDDQRLIIKLPNPQNDATRRRQRELIEKYLGISMAWPTGKGLHLPDDFRPAAHTILLVHGLESRGEELGRFQQACRNRGVQTLLFDYPNDGPIAWSGDRLSDELKALCEKQPELRLAIVGYSMGGLVARYCLETPGKQPGCVTDLFMLGTPNHGSSFSGVQPWMQLYGETFSKYGLRGGILQDGLGEAADDLRPDSEFLKALNARPRPPVGVTYHAAAGTNSLLPRSALLTAQIAATQLPSGKSREQLLAMLSSPELQAGQGDGAVAVDAALLAGVESRHTFAVNHLELISLPGEPPETCEVFRWIIETLGWQRP
jgi:pimeloyl-ACP methyl ester carboxylesterase